jgi:hypothetical protein
MARMTTRTFTLTLYDCDRLAILTALGFAAMHLIGSEDAKSLRKPIDELIQRLSSANGQDFLPEFGYKAPFEPNVQPGVHQDSGTAAARAVLSSPPTVTYHDYFAKDRAGNLPVTAPTGARLQFVDVQATKESLDRKHLKVTFKGGKANCFDRELWPMISRQTGHQHVGLWVIEKGEYLNIVGVRA